MTAAVIDGDEEQEARVWAGADQGAVAGALGALFVQALEAQHLNPSAVVQGLIAEELTARGFGKGGQ